MTLPSSGSISLNQMHIEVGGSSGSTVSINDSDIRGLIGKGSGATMSFSEWYGASSFTQETQLVISPANSGVKYASPSYSTYNSGIISGTLGSASDNRIELDQGQYCYFQNVMASFFIAGSATYDFTSGSGSTSGMSRTDYLSGHYWRTGSIGGTGNPSNTLFGTSTATDLRPTFQFNGQRISLSSTNGFPLGNSNTATVTIQVY